jgi:hypothetical protein
MKLGLNGWVPKTKGIVQPMITGVGFDGVAKFIDGATGGILQSFGVNVPVVGRISAIDLLNFFVNAGGFKFSRKEGYIAVGAAKLLQAGVGNIRPLNLLGSTNVSTQSMPASGANL